MIPWSLKFDIFEIMKMWSLKLFGNLWGNSHIPFLSLAIMFCFTSKKRKNWQKIRKSQNSMTTVVVVMLLDLNICSKKRKPGLEFRSLEMFYFLTEILCEILVLSIIENAHPKSKQNLWGACGFVPKYGQKH